MKREFIFGILGIFLTLLVIVSVRLVTIHDPGVHYHANFALFIDDKRVDFSKPEYSEEIQSCTVSDKQTPKQRVHLHEKNPDVVHIHASGVAWGHLFQNLGYGVGDSYIVDDKGVIFQDSAEKKLVFVLNGKEVTSIANKMIDSEDRLLVNYGTSTPEELIKGKFNEVSQTAHEFNIKNDPATCAGTTGKFNRLLEAVKLYR